MHQTETKISDACEVSSPESRDTIARILWQSLRQALVQAFIIQITGGIAITLLRGVLREMIPSRPPVSEHAFPAAPQSPALNWAKTYITGHAFWIIFAALFTVITATRLAPFLRLPEHRELASSVLRIHHSISRQWFRLFVFNAFAAWISTIVFFALQRFSWTHVLWLALGQVFQPLVNLLASIFPRNGSLARWYEWYGQNQAKFLFWLLYSAAICDDLGLPNYKAIIRWAGHRVFCYFGERKPPASPAK